MKRNLPIQPNQVLFLGQDDFVLRQHCPGCGSSNIGAKGNVPSRLYHVYPFGKVKIENSFKSKISLFLCLDCDLYFKNYIPNNKSVKLLYSQHGDQHIVWKYELHNKYDEFKLKIIKSFMQKGQECLDIGCHSGGFLNLLRQAGFKTNGCDISRNNEKTLSKVITEHFYEGFFDAINFHGAQFDFITLWDVVEHIENIKQDFSEIYDILKPGGFLFVETGNIDHWSAKLFKRKDWWYITSLNHFSFFNLTAFDKIFSPIGAEIVYHKKTHHKSHDQFGLVYRLKNYIKLFAYLLSSENYENICKIFRTSGALPHLNVKDHLFIVLRKT